MPILQGRSSPFKQIFREGDRLIISGRVLDMQCNPVKGAVLDFDKLILMENMTMRDLYLGKIQTDNEGKYVSDTKHPKQYGEGDFIRPSYIHVKVGIPDQPMYTTQLYFEGDPYLTNHEKQKPSLIMKVIKENSSKKANFDL